MDSQGAHRLAGWRVPLQLPLALTRSMPQSRLVEWLRWPRRRPTDRAEFESLAVSLLSGKGEASGVALATEILDRYRELKTGPRIAFFEALTEHFGQDRARVEAAIFESLNAASVRPSNVSRVLLTGGTSQIPLLNRMVERIFGADKIVRPDYFSSVATGLGYVASRFG